MNEAIRRAIRDYTEGAIRDARTAIVAMARDDVRDGMRREAEEKARLAWEDIRRAAAAAVRDETAGWCPFVRKRTVGDAMVALQAIVETRWARLQEELGEIGEVEREPEEPPSTPPVRPFPPHPADYEADDESETKAVFYSRRAREAAQRRADEIDASGDVDIRDVLAAKGKLNEEG